MIQDCHYGIVRGPADFRLPVPEEKPHRRDRDRSVLRVCVLEQEDGGRRQHWSFEPDQLVPGYTVRVDLKKDK